MDNVNAERKVEISIIIPFFNEEANVGILYKKLKGVLGEISRAYEIIFVDDGSKDATFRLLCDIRKDDPCIRIIKLRRNFGQTAALSAGVDLAVGEIIITMDGDLQHDPEDIPLFLKEMENGFDIVTSWRKNRNDHYFLRVLPSVIANNLIRWISGVKVHDFGGTYRAYRKEIIKKVELFGDAHRFIPALSSALGATVCEVPVKSIARKFGKSHYGIERALGVVFDLFFLKFLLGYVRRPLLFFGTLAILMLGIGVLISCVLIFMFFLHIIPNLREHIAMLMLSVFLMMAGIQFLVLGIIAELIARIYFGFRNQKIYEIAQVI